MIKINYYLLENNLNRGTFQNSFKHILYKTTCLPLKCNGVLYNILMVSCFKYKLFQLMAQKKKKKHQTTSIKQQEIIFKYQVR